MIVRPNSSAVFIGTIMALALPCLSGETDRAILHVATTGNDAWSGTGAEPADDDGPLATLQGARDAIRKLKAEAGLPPGGIEVLVHGGTYTMSATLELSAKDSGTAEAPIVYRAAPGQQVRLTGGSVVDNFAPVADPAVLERLEESARGQVYQADLKALGITDFGEVTGGGKRLELFFNDRPMTVSRWPNEGFTIVVEPLGDATPRGRAGPVHQEGRFIYEGDRPERWVDEDDVWLHGYWFHDWSDERMRVAAIDTEERSITLAPPQHLYGYRRGGWYYAFNALSEVDEPGEWYLQRDTGMLYFYPPESVDTGHAVVSRTPTLLTMDDVSHVTVRGFIFEAARGNGIIINGGTSNRIIGCTLRNLGSGAVMVGGGADHGVIGCDITQTGGPGINLTGGDRKSLTPAGHFAVNNHIHHYARWHRVYQPGIRLSGVGNRAAHNLIHNAPHMAMGLGGNDHVIEFNEIHSVCYESNDAGAIYSGRNWTMRGNVIRHNYMHDVSGFGARGAVGVYLDDMFSSADIIGNVFYKVHRAAFIGGGRHCTVANNIFVDCTPALHVDARALGWAHYHADQWLEEAESEGTISKIAYDKPPYSERYPKLARILEDEPKAPEGTLVARNISFGGRWDGITADARPYVHLEDNLIDVDPHFIDMESGNFQLRTDSPAFDRGFERIPISRIGLIDDDTRASWPVHHTVRPVQRESRPRAYGTTPTVLKITRTKADVIVDGEVNETEWGDDSRAIVIEQGLRGGKTEHPTRVWLAHDGTHLLVAAVNPVNPDSVMKTGDVWGVDEAVEIAVCNTGAGVDAPILVLRGFVSGFFQSSEEANAPAEDARRAAQGVEYATRVVGPAQWQAEWRIPFTSLGIDPASDSMSAETRLAFNFTVRKTADRLWQMWRGTGGSTWDVYEAGFIELVP
jgi:hypothetical protein